MSGYVPLHSTPTDHPVLLIDSSASLVDLLVCADQRIRVIYKLMSSLSCMTARTADESDLFQIADIASLLLSDGVALLDVAQGKAMQGCWRLNRLQAPHGSCNVALQLFRLELADDSLKQPGRQNEGDL
ncbi:hypothetical protein SAMN03159362_4696 [Pseudomonas sp. NFIX51]|uniref:hypothetical protein n=1 Tax=unclassified Pseudomonas TaxID=196821 RepID=UPI0008D687CF|nr:MULTISPECIES: hypothetical protein [unclassified Pseudomonas]SEM42810.1 hypothetical protein SAMN03159414_5252 [Pseudomonas sp. NFACC41-3]SMH59483.1 hypothetical protein SAMN03159362_4696 [Pseudomonas sp. NFIX51]